MKIYNPNQKDVSPKDQEQLSKHMLEVTKADLYHNNPVGLPDEKDVANIQAIFRQYELAKPGAIAAYAADAKRSRAQNLNDYGLTSMGGARRVLSMPAPLMKMVEEAYPLMFKNKDQLKWWKRTFPHFNTADKH